MGVCKSLAREEENERLRAIKYVTFHHARNFSGISEASSFGENGLWSAIEAKGGNGSASFSGEGQPHPLRDARTSESVHTVTVEKFHFGSRSSYASIPDSSCPGAGVYKIPNDLANRFSPRSPSSMHPRPEVMTWSVKDVVKWWCEKLPDDAIQYAPLIEDAGIRGEDLIAMDLELLMSFQIESKLAEKIEVEINKLLRSDYNSNRETFESTTGETENEFALICEDFTNLYLSVPQSVLDAAYRHYQSQLGFLAQTKRNEISVSFIQDYFTLPDGTRDRDMVIMLTDTLKESFRHNLYLQIMKSRTVSRLSGIIRTNGPYISRKAMIAATHYVFRAL